MEGLVEQARTALGGLDILVVNAGGPFDLSIRVTNLGLGFILMTLVVAIGATNTGNNGLYLVLAGMLAAMVVSGVIRASAPTESDGRGARQIVEESLHIAGRIGALLMVNLLVLLSAATQLNAAYLFFAGWSDLEGAVSGHIAQTGLDRGGSASKALRCSVASAAARSTSLQMASRSAGSLRVASRAHSSVTPPSGSSPIRCSRCRSGSGRISPGTCRLSTTRRWSRAAGS